MVKVKVSFYILRFNAPKKLTIQLILFLIKEVVHYPTEFLNYLNPPGTPSFKLILKVGSSIILLQNHGYLTVFGT
jgi:hypothetical protein